MTAGLAIKDKIIAQIIPGSEGFVSWVRENFLEGPNDRERPAVGRIHRYVSTEEITAVAEEKTGIKNTLQSTGTTRQIIMSVLYRYAGLNNREIGNLRGVDYSTVSQGRKRLRSKAEQDRTLKNVIDRIEGRLSKIKI